MKYPMELVLSKYKAVNFLRFVVNLPYALLTGKGVFVLDAFFAYGAFAVFLKKLVTKVLNKM